MSYVRIHLALLLCSRAQWTAAYSQLEDLRQKLHDSSMAKAEPISSLVQYLAGVIAQGLGNFDAALSIFQSPAFNLDTNAIKEPNNSAQHIQHDLAILANLNTILILRSRSSPQRTTIKDILSKIEPYCLSSSNKNMHSALNLIKATSIEEESMIGTKRYLEQALTTARTLPNQQLTCLALNVLAWKFLRGVVGEQAEKGARAGVNVATKTDNSLWISVSKGMLADALEVQGKTAEAKATRQEALGIVSCMK